MRKFAITLFFLLSVQFSFGQATHIYLKRGITNYQLEGNKNAPLLVLVHGVSGPMSVWDMNIQKLIAEGYQVLRYDLYGRGNSSRVNEDYNTDLFIDQLENLLVELDLQDKQINFIASSMGNIIVSEFTLKNTHRVRSLTLVGPAGFDIGQDLSSKLATIPLLGGAMNCLFGGKIMTKRNREYFVQPQKFESFLDAYQKQLEIKGSKKAILSTMINMPVRNYLHGYEQLAQLEIPTLLIWGKKDVSFDFRFSSSLLKVYPHASFLPVENAAHLPQYEQSLIVNSKIIEFLFSLEKKMF